MIIFGLSFCPVKRKVPAYDIRDCGTAYHTNELHFSHEQIVNLPIRFVKFSDTLGEINNTNFDSLLTYINKSYAVADIKFRLDTIEEIVNPDIKNDMPAFIKYGKKYYKPYVITCFIYGDKQDNFSDDLSSVAGVSAGVPSMFFAIRDSFKYKSTIIHELGHCLGLYHYDTPDDTDGLNIYSGDKVCDTRSANNLHEKVGTDCIYLDDDHTLPEQEKQQRSCNLMSWVYLHCRSCFTEIQIEKMRFTIHESPELRHSIK